MVAKVAMMVVVVAVVVVAVAREGRISGRTKAEDQFLKKAVDALLIRNVMCLSARRRRCICASNPLACLLQQTIQNNDNNHTY